MNSTPMDAERSAPRAPAPRALSAGAPNTTAGCASLFVAAFGLFVVAANFVGEGPFWVVAISGALGGLGLFAALYFFTDARPTVRPPPPRPNPTARLPYCPYCGRPRRPTGAFCHTCGGRA